MTNGDIAIALALLGCALIALVLGYWQATQSAAQRLPYVCTFAAIGGFLALFGAICFAIAFLLGD